ncbi:unnamed protein product [Microthlaspi erraticum]|uniref:VQ domain-containing protein n=1 Tax=Microthlaspi erraticum TaxID=1685480 RepID=A0A6D2J4S1_9BRAS|nr:unnamed protein product [Microthlaspi erraticum]
MEPTSQAFMSQGYLNAQETETSETKNYLTSLRSTRKQPSKPLKRPATSSILSSPLKPMHPQVYQVEPVNFKELVQRLTGAPEHEDVAKPFKSLNDAAQESPCSFEFDLSSSSWGDLSLQKPANLSRW